jgi:endonuclease/exonuclease/phosphatase family metal-dependent hydrolase
MEQMASGRPALLAGDFNCTPDSACHEVFTRRGKTGTPGEAPFRNVFKPPFPGTFHGFKGGEGEHCIDWILFQGPIITNTARVIRFPKAACCPSDHYPVMAEFSWDRGKNST